jgi:hypothetical protein
MSPLVSSALWSRMKPYLFVIAYDKDGGHADPRIRIEFRDIPDHLSREAQDLIIPCVTCKRPSHPLRRREGDGFDRLYYAPACPVGVRAACSRSAPAHEEYERFKLMDWAQGKSTQLSLF